MTRKKHGQSRLREKEQMLVCTGKMSYANQSDFYINQVVKGLR